jgi:hypothetical protein
MDVVERHLELTLREPRNSADATSADAVGDEDPLTRLEATDTRVMRRLLPRATVTPGVSDWSPQKNPASDARSSRSTRCPRRPRQRLSSP